MRTCDGVDGNARLLVDHSPERPRQVEEERLAGEHQRHPLVVADLLNELRFLFLRSADILVNRQVVRVLRPADLSQQCVDTR